MITAIHSATVCVHDQDRALDFYLNALGFRQLVDLPYGNGSRWIVVAPAGADTGLALVTPRDVGLGPESVGTHTGISLLADDISATYEQLREPGVQFTEPPKRMPWGALPTWFNDQEGNQFFLSEPN